MKKLKPLLPTLREKKRYLAFEIISRKPVTGFQAVSKAIWCQTLMFFGESGASKAGIMLLPDQYNTKKQKGIMKVSNRYVDYARAALCLINNIEGQEAIARSLGLSGMLNKAKKYL